MIHLKSWYCTTPPTFRFVVFSLAIPGCYICLILSPFRGSTEIALLESHYTASLDYIQSGVSVTASNVKVSHPYWRYSPGSIEVGKQAMCSLSYWKFDSPLHVYISTYSIDLDSTRWYYWRLVCCWFISGQGSLKLCLNLVLTYHLLNHSLSSVNSGGLRTTSSNEYSPGHWRGDVLYHFSRL